MANRIGSFMAGVVASGAIAGAAVVAQSPYEGPSNAGVFLAAPDPLGECHADVRLPVIASGAKEPSAIAHVELVVPCENFDKSLDGARIYDIGSWPKDAPPLPFPKYEPPVKPSPVAGP
jgi:hypothetical protein